MAKRTPIVQGNTLTYQHDEQERTLLVETPAWYTWLETASTFAFTSEAGTFTARKERAGNRRGGWYWKAYHKQHGQLASHYLGKTETLTLARLQEGAQALAAALVETRPHTDADAAAPLVHVAAPGMRSGAFPPLLATKLYRPLSRGHLVRRPQLMARLTQGAERSLTLVSAPAGFGKTTLLAQWLAENDTPSAWLSLGAEENDPVRFLVYFVAAVQTHAPTIGAEVLKALQSPQPPPIAALLVTLLNDLTHISDPFVLVLDDYHLIEAQVVDQTLTYLVEHLPPQLHLILATRENPQFSLARFRARGQLTELRAADLRFTPEEAAAFLNQIMGLHLEASDIAALEQRTEGWIAGLQFAALSLQGQRDVARFIQSFTGSHQFVLDYLVEEVLHQQSEQIQTFLLRTSILERLCGSLCDAVLLDPATPGQATLEALERANLFLVPLDHERRWYRYHHLFAEVLRQRLHQHAASAPGDAETRVAALHVRASVWYEAQGLELEAFHHAAAAYDVERAAHLLESKGMSQSFRGATVPVLRWLKSLPAAVLDARPSLWVKYALLLLTNGQVADVEEKLHAAEVALEGTEPDDGTRDLVGQIAISRAVVALTRYQGDTMLAQAHRALASLPSTSLASRTTATWTLGYAYLLQRDRAAARRAFSEAIVLGQACGESFLTLLATLSLGYLQEVAIQLPLAAETYRHVLHLAGEQPLQVIYEAHLGLARICYEWNDQEEAWLHGQQSLHLARQYGSGIDRFVLCEIFLARLKLAQGDVADAAARLSRAREETLQHNFAQRMPDVAAAQVLTFLRQGKVDAAARLAEAHDLPLSQARVHLAQGNPSAALAVLARLREQAEAKGWQDEQLRVIVLEALALQAHGDKRQAVDRLCDALAMAEPAGLIRLFVDEGSPMAHLLSQAETLGMMPDYLGKVLAAYRAEKHQSENKASPPLAQPLIEPLSPREIEVLRLIAAGLSNQEIGERLFLALETVKGYNKKIFGKLQVQRRTEAVARARQLGLL